MSTGPDWVEAALEELERLPEPHREKKQATVIALVDAKLAGRSEESVWGLPTVCARSTYHGKWRKDPLFADVLERVGNLARGWVNGRSVRALQEAAERLALASPVAVSTSIQHLQHPDGNVALRAAFGILDRAGMETAAKGSQRVENEVTLDADQFAVLMGEAQEQAAEIEAEALSWDPEQAREDDGSI